MQMIKLKWLEHLITTDMPKVTFDEIFKDCKNSVSVMCRSMVSKHYNSLSEDEQRKLIKIYEEMTIEQIKKPHQ